MSLVTTSSRPKQLGRETDVVIHATGLHWAAINRMISILIVFSAFFAPVAGASEPNWSSKPVSYYASEQPLRDVLTNIAGYQGLKMMVSPEVDQTVSLTFDKKPLKEAFLELIEMNDLVWYFDGQVMFIYTPQEIKTATVKLKQMSPTAFTTAVKESGIAIDKDSWRVSEQDGLVFFSGTTRFVEQVMELSQSLERQSRTVVYKWKDKEGQTHYSSSPPEEEKHRFEVLDFRLSQARGMTQQ